MAQFDLNWDNTEVLANANNTAQRASYRQKSVGGAWITAGFTPANDLATSATTVETPVLTNNVVYEFKIESICDQGGPTPNDNGIIEAIGFSCIAPITEQTDDTATVVVNLVNTDITKVRFTLRKSSDNTIVYGPITVNRAGNSAQAIAPGLTPNTGYYWQTVFYATVNGVEVVSSSVEQLNAVCGPYSFTTDEIIQDLVWIADDTVCETGGSFGVVKTISGLSSPYKTWFDIDNNRMYVADVDNPNGNVYWFDPATATVEADMTYSATIQDDELYNTQIDGTNKKIYFVGRNSGGMKVYDIVTDTISTVAFGTDGAAFVRTDLWVLGDRIYCNDGSTSIIIIDRATLTVLDTVAIAGIPNPTHFNTGPRILTRVGTSIYVVSNNAGIGTVGVYDLDLTTSITEITLTSSAVWSGGTYWQTIFYDPISDRLFAGDVGSNRRYIIDPNTNTVTHNIQYTNLEAKSNCFQDFILNPINNDLYCLMTLLNDSSDVAPVKRTFVVNRTNGTFTNIFENKFFNNPSLITETDQIATTDLGLVFWSGDPDYDIDGSITILSTSASGANTGTKITTTLQEVDANNGNTPTGQTKPNVPDDPDYIAPTTDLTACPLVATLTCPADLVTTFGGATLEYEFAILNSVKNNPAIAKIQIFAYNTDTVSTEGSPTVVNAPFTSNYYSGTFAGLGGTNYTIQVRYLDSVDTILQTC